jgi:hypothetical protein
MGNHLPPPAYPVQFDDVSYMDPARVQGEQCLREAVAVIYPAL